MYGTELQNALNVLREGGTLLYPTDTLWGIGCDATSELAVNKIFSLKKREKGKSMLVLVDDENRIGRYVKHVPDVAWELLECAEKPLTIIYPGGMGLAKNVLAEDGSIGIRVVKDNFCRELVRRFGKPVVSTSANKSGGMPPACFREIHRDILNGVDYIVNLKQDDAEMQTASSIIKLDINGTFKIIRK